MTFKKQFKSKSEALIEADKILRSIHHYNGKYKHLIESSYLERLSDETKIVKEGDDIKNTLKRRVNEQEKTL